MRSITAGPSIRETIRISFWHFGQRSGSASHNHETSPLLGRYNSTVSAVPLIRHDDKIGGAFEPDGVCSGRRVDAQDVRARRNGFHHNLTLFALLKHGQESGVCIPLRTQGGDQFHAFRRQKRDARFRASLQTQRVRKGVREPQAIREEGRLQIGQRRKARNIRNRIQQELPRRRFGEMIEDQLVGRGVEVVGAARRIEML
jgi:hypothetical protein